VLGAGSADLIDSGDPAEDMVGRARSSRPMSNRRIPGVSTRGMPNS